MRQRLVEEAVAEQERVVGKTDEVPGLPYLGIAQAQPDREAERIPDDAQGEQQRRQQESDGEQTPLAVYPFTAPAVMPATKWSTKNE